MGWGEVGWEGKRWVWGLISEISSDNDDDKNNNNKIRVGGERRSKGGQ